MEEEYIKALIQNGWLFKKPENKLEKLNLSGYANDRLQHLESSFINFTTLYDILANAADDVWYIPLNHYSPDFINDEGFAWNEFEIQSLEYADSDEERKEISSFWENHLPFLYSVKDGYAFIAIILKGEDKGKIVFGREPEYEDVELIANSFKEFLKMHSIFLTEASRLSLLRSFI